MKIISSLDSDTTMIPLLPSDESGTLPHREIDPASHTLPFSSPIKSRWKKQRSRGKLQQGCSEFTPAQCPCASLSPQCAESPVLFIHTNQRPSSGGSSIVSFGGIMMTTCLSRHLVCRRLKRVNQPDHGKSSELQSSSKSFQKQ